MSSAFAIGLALLLGLAPVVLVVVALARPARTGIVLVVLATTVFGVMIYSASPLTARPPAEARQWLSEWAASPASQRTDAAQCSELLEAATTHRVILDASDPTRPVVAAAIWAQLPEEARAVIEQCLRDAQPASGAQDTFEVIER